MTLKELETLQKDISEAQKVYTMVNLTANEIENLLASPDYAAEVPDYTWITKKEKREVNAVESMSSFGNEIADLFEDLILIIKRIPSQQEYLCQSLKIMKNFWTDKKHHTKTKGLAWSENKYLKFELCPNLLKIPAEILPTVKNRKSLVEFIIEEYFATFSEFPKAVPLSMLSDFLMLDYIQDKGKKKSDELQFHTHSQEKRRKIKEFSALSDDIDFFQSRDVREMDSLKRKANVSNENG